MLDFDFDSALVVFADDAKPFIHMGTVEGKPRYRKELIHVGTFFKDETKFEITEDLLTHWANTFSQFQQNGIGVPVPVEHTTDPEKNRGQVVRMSVEKNSRGIPALFGVIEFKDNESAKLAETAQVSIFSPPDFNDGRGRRYYRPVRHVALTDYPVVPKLDNFEIISASLSNGEDLVMSTIKNLATQMGIEFEKDASDEVVCDKIATSYQAMSEASKPKDPPPEEENDEEKPPVPPVENSESPKPPMKKEGEEDEEEEKDKVIASLRKKSIKSGKTSRKNEINNLVLSGKLSKAAATKLEEVWCTDDALAFSLENDSADDTFDATIASLASNENIISFDESTGPQLGGTSKKKSSLVANAEARNKQ